MSESADEPVRVPNALDGELWRTVREAATLLGISERAVQKRITREQIVCKRVGREWRVLVPDEPMGTPSVREPNVSDEPSARTSTESASSLFEQMQSEIGYLRSELTAQREARDQADSEFRRLLLSRDMEIQRLQMENRKLLTAAPVIVEAEPTIEDTQNSPSAPHTAQELAIVDKVLQGTKAGQGNEITEKDLSDAMQRVDQPKPWWHKLLKWRG